ncbi:MAG TPA: hypothetical protein VFT22_27710 [Kofleriaceae bacterium]|nr:hypothetical protein [Kofleriaceae bacterium]
MMVRSTHTPGRWRICGTYSAIVADVASGYDDPENVTAYGGHLIAESVKPHNRPIIAAAPDLLAACWAALDEDSGLSCAPQLRAAILAAGAIPPGEEPTP